MELNLKPDIGLRYIECNDRRTRYGNEYRDARHVTAGRERDPPAGSSHAKRGSRWQGSHPQSWSSHLLPNRKEHPLCTSWNNYGRTFPGITLDDCDTRSRNDRRAGPLTRPLPASSPRETVIPPSLDLYYFTELNPGSYEPCD